MSHPDVLVERLAAAPMPLDELIAYLTSSYYEQAKIGRDFNTPPEFFPQLGSCFARMALSAYRQLGQPKRFAVFEAGGGNGTLALSFLLEAQKQPEFSRALEYHLIEQSSALASLQQQRFEHHGLRDKLSWHVTDVAKFAFPRMEAGMYIAMENDDDLPCKAVYKRANMAKEVFVTVQNGRVREVVAEPSPALRNFIESHADWWDRIPENLPSYLPVHMDSLRIRQKLVQNLEQGLIVTTDYGYSFQVQAYTPDLTAPLFNVFFDNQRLKFDGSPFETIFELQGKANFTADVDFDLLSLPGKKAGFDTRITELHDLLNNFGLKEYVSQTFATLHQLGELTLLRNYALRLSNIVDTRWLCAIQEKGLCLELSSTADDLDAWLHSKSSEYFNVPSKAK
jgi:SAM-dependent MidA family methyltransferase